MILESITIQNFRKLTDRIVIDGLESGLNLISGPKLHAEGAPMKCRPSTEDSKAGVSRGKPSARETERDSSGERNEYREMSILKPVARTTWLAML